MEFTDLAIITQFAERVLASLPAMFVGRRLAKRDALRQSTLDRFHKLVLDVNDFSQAAVARQRHFKELANANLALERFSNPNLEKIWQVRDNGPATLRDVQTAAAAVRAGMMIVAMVHGKRAKGLRDELAALLDAGAILDGEPSAEEAANFNFQKGATQVEQRIAELWE